MARVEKNAAGELVPVDTPEFGCIVIEAAAADPVEEPAATKTKAKAAKSESETADEGVND